MSPEKSPLQSLNLLSEEAPLQSSNLTSKESPRLPHVRSPVKKSLLPSYSRPKRPRHDFDSAAGTLSSGDESDDHAEVALPDKLTSVCQACPKCPTLEENITELEEKIMRLKRKLKETKTQLKGKECGVYTSELDENNDKLLCIRFFF